MAIKTANISCELREVLLNDKPDQMLEVSSKGTVPVMILSDSTVIDESIDLMIWALQQFDPENWLHASKSETLALVYENDYEFKKQLDYYKYHIRYPENTQLEYRQQAEIFVNKLEKLLVTFHGHGLLADRTTLADVAIFPFIRQFANVDRAWFDKSKYSRLRNWLLSFENSFLFNSVMDKYHPWKYEKNITIFA